MKGLIIKDIMCLRKNIITYILVSFIIMIMAILVFLSSKYGNIASTVEEMKQNGEISDASFLNSFFKSFIYIIGLVPLMFNAEAPIACFDADRKASFGKLLFSMPIANSKIVGARFISMLLLLGVGYMISLFCGFLVSLVPGTIQMLDFFRVVTIAVIILLIFSTIIISLTYLFGASRVNSITVFLFVVPSILLMAYLAFKSIQYGDEVPTYLMGVFSNVKQFLSTNVVPICLCGIALAVLAYVLSVLFLNRRGGEL